VFSIPKAQAWAASYSPPPHGPSCPSNTQEKDNGALLNLSQGVPGDPPHPSVLDALATTSADPKSAGYGPILGERLLREAVREEMEYVYGFNDPRGSGGADGVEGSGEAVGEEGIIVESTERGDEPPTWDEVAITSGCNQAFFNTVMTLCDRGDKVIIPVPWVSLPIPLLFAVFSGFPLVSLSRNASCIPILAITLDNASSLEAQS
jgi:hypothetical protein